MSEITVDRYKVRQSGHRGATVTLPASWLDDLGLLAGDSIEMKRDDADRLILIGHKKREPVVTVEPVEEKESEK